MQLSRLPFGLFCLCIIAIPPVLAYTFIPSAGSGAAGEDRKFVVGRWHEENTDCSSHIDFTPSEVSVMGRQPNGEPNPIPNMPYTISGTTIVYELKTKFVTLVFSDRHRSEERSPRAATAPHQPRTG